VWDRINSYSYPSTLATRPAIGTSGDLKTAIETTRFVEGTALLSIALWQCWASIANQRSWICAFGGNRGELSKRSGYKDIQVRYFAGDERLGGAGRRS
jgi:SAM-dependent MidA family methyltransferase